MRPKRGSNHFKFRELQQQLLGAYVFKLYGSLSAVTCTFDTEDFASPKTVVDDATAYRERGMRRSGNRGGVY